MKGELSVSKEWLEEHALRETKRGWEDGPRWRLRSEQQPAVEPAKISPIVRRPVAA